MRAAVFLSAVCAAAFAVADSRTVQVFIQPIAAASRPEPLAEVSYDPTLLSSSSIVSYEAPDIPESAELVRIGLYDKKSASWISGTTVASTENFSKGYSPTVMLTVNAQGDVLSVACKSIAIDAGVTRDFGPKAMVQVESKGKQPDLNKPIVLSPEGKKVEEQEKTLFQKYWWVLGIIAFLAFSGSAEK